MGDGELAWTGGGATVRERGSRKQESQLQAGHSLQVAGAEPTIGRASERASEPRQGRVPSGGGAQGQHPSLSGAAVAMHVPSFARRRRP